MKLYSRCEVCHVFKGKCPVCKGTGFVEAGITQEQVNALIEDRVRSHLLMQAFSGPNVARLDALAAKGFFDPDEDPAQN